MYSDLLFLPEKIKNEKCKKRFDNIHDKKVFVVHIKALKQTDAKKVHRGIEFNQQAFLCIEINRGLRKQTKNDFSKGFFKLMNISVFGKTMENVRETLNL